MSILQSIPNKKKFYLLLIGLVAMFLMVWFISIEPTMDLMGTKKELKVQIEQADELHLQISGLNQERSFLENLLGQDGLSSAEMQAEVLRFASEREKVNVRLESFDPLHEALDYDCQIITQSFTLSGGFHDILDVISGFENEFQWARLTSVNMWTEENPRNKKKKLYAKLYLQNIQKSS